MQPQISKGSEPIPGYRVTSFLGSGGFGEVWEATAPGGLNKAIKFVFGCHDQHRAATELKALERVREVRHPFLISLERIEIVDGRLIIVTELAEGSLRDRVNTCRRNGLPGVPRGELCAYLRDAADALDYMSTEHSLQHLDVKPENILLLSGHVKVVDFGLVKNLQNLTVTLMSGLTPLYAAPEVLRGAPTDRSDQYSLAAVYTEMLTGKPPFSGATAGELTYQHLNEDPDLSNLPESDRPVIARALSKEPTDRFPTCKDLAAALLEVRTTDVPQDSLEDDPVDLPDEFGPTLDLAPGEQVPNSVTMICEEETGELSAVCLAHSSLNLPPLSDSPTCDVPPLPLDAQHDRPIPTVFLGIGGSAGHVLRDLRRRLCNRFGHVAAVPAIRMLLFDTDPKSLVQVLGGDERSALDREDTFALPLRRPKQIRSKEERMLSWLNRRWLYNIPKSLRTEGLRPLGRLAFVEHAEDAMDRIRQAIQKVTSTQAIEETTKNTGLTFREDAVRVYLISSISGGSGSGMVLDVAYAARKILDELAVGQPQVIGVFTHSTGKKSRHRDVAMVNAFSWLTEFNHYTRPGGSYPGDKTCGLPSFDGGSAALEQSYLVHLGDDLSEEEFIRTTEAVSQYVYLDSLTPGASFFSACRQHTDDEPDVIQNQARLRTFGVHTVSGYPQEIIQDTIADLCRRVLLLWANGDDAATGTNDVESLRHSTEEKARDLGLNCQTLVGQAHATIERILGCNGARFLERLFDGKNQFDADQFARAIQTVDKVFGVDEASTGSFRILERPIGEIAAPILKQRFEEIRQWIVGQIERPDGRMAGAREANQWFTKHLRAIEVETKNLERYAKQKHRDLARAAVPDTVQEGDQQRPGMQAHELRDYFLVRLDERALQLVAYLAGSLREQLEGVAVELADLTRELESRASECIRCTNIVVQDQLFDDAGPMSDVRNGVAESLQMSMEDLLVQVNRRIDVHLNEDHGGLYRAMTRRRGPNSPMLDTLRRVASQAVMHAVSKTDLLGNMLPPGLDAQQRQARVRECLEGAAPTLMSYGGARRLLAVLPSSVLDPQASVRQLQELGISGAVVVGSDNEFTCCYEMGWISVAHAAVDLIQRSLRHAECSVRLHTRCDVHWTPLASSCVPAGVPQLSNS